MSISDLIKNKFVEEFTAISVGTLLTTLRKTLTALCKKLTSRGSKTHQTLTQIRTLIRKTR